MHLLLTIAAIVFCSCDSIHAQDSTELPETRHIVILNKKYEPFKEINIGDFVRVVLTNSMRIRGHITSIDSTFFRVENFVVHLNEIEKISTKNISKKSKKLLGVALISVGIVGSLVTLSIYAVLDPGGLGSDPPTGPYLVYAGLTAVGVRLLLPPGYYKIGKSKFLLISNNPNTVNN
jgi:hypothetical protein